MAAEAQATPLPHTHVVVSGMSPVSLLTNIPFPEVASQILPGSPPTGQQQPPVLGMLGTNICYLSLYKFHCLDDKWAWLSEAGGHTSAYDLEAPVPSENYTKANILLIYRGSAVKKKVLPRRIQQY